MFYRRIFITRGFKILTNVLLSIVVILIGVFFIIQLFACGTKIHPGKFGTLLDPKKQCINTFASAVAYALSDVVVDLVILGTPIPIVSSSVSIEPMLPNNLHPDLEAPHVSQKKIRGHSNIHDGNIVGNNDSPLLSNS